MGKTPSISPEKKKSKKEKKHKKEKKKSRSDSPRSLQIRPYSRQSKEKRRKQKKQKEKKKQKDRSRSREKSKQKPKEIVKEKPVRQIIERQPSPSPSPYIPPPRQKSFDDQERARKIAMRKVRARLLKFNQIFNDGNDQNADKSDDQVKPSASVPPPQPIPSTPNSGLKPKAGKRESKWGRVNSSEPSLIPNQMQGEVQAQPSTHSQQKSRLGLQLEQSQDHLKLSEDKSIDAEDSHPNPNLSHLEPIDEEYVDPLDQYMMQLEGKAAPQMDLALKPKANVISFQDVVTSINSISLDSFKVDTKADDDEQKQEQIKKSFMSAISKLQETKQYNKADQRGVLMQNNEQNKEQLSDFHQQKQPELDFFAKQRKMAERKQLHQIDHSKIVYEEVRFNLYREAQQVKNYNPKQVYKYRKEAGDIKVRGKDVLNPVFNWYHCGYSDKILSIIQKRQYKKPFPIQAQSMPLLLSGRDVIAVAETGSGKTLAYLLPVIRHIQDQKPVSEGQGPISIIMTPTRELARQVYVEAKNFCKPLGIRVLAVYGGLGVQGQLSQFRSGAQLVVCTPGRMIDILTLNRGKITNLKRLTFLVIDEADRMFDLGFQPQITRIIDNIRPVRQIALFSATFPKNVQILARKILNKPVEVIVGSRGQACANVEQIVEVREQATKLWRLLEVLGVWNEKGSVLIFVDKQTEADYLFQQLLKYGYHSLVLHGAMDPDDRQFTIYDFKRGVQTIMIATSVCARGLDIRSIILVVNFKCPNHLEDYIHRIGRTGRGGNKGTAITFITPEEEQYSIDLLKALEMAEIHPPEDLIKLSQTYLGKVKKGEARRMRNRNIQGNGFKFDEEEQEKAVQIKDMIKKQMKNEGLGFDSDEDDIEMKKKKEEDIRGRNHQDRIAEAIKNPQIKNKLLNQAVKAVSDAIKNGSAITTEKLLQIAVGSMRESVTKYKVVKTVDDGVEQVTKLINQFQSKTGGEGSDFFSYDFEINDYPQGARQKACNTSFMQQIQHTTNCSVSLRGVYVQPGKKAQVGCRKLYLHIQGENKYYVTEAYKEIKRVLEESAYESMHMGGTGKYTI